MTGCVEGTHGCLRGQGACSMPAGHDELVVRSFPRLIRAMFQCPLLPHVHMPILYNVLEVNYVWDLDPHLKFC